MTKYVEANLTILVPVQVRASFEMSDSVLDQTESLRKYLTKQEQGQVKFRSLDLLERIGDIEINRAEALDAFSTVDGEDVEFAIGEYLDTISGPTGCTVKVIKSM